MTALKTVGMVVGVVLVLVLGMVAECYLRNLARKPIPVLLENTVRAEVVAHVQPDFLWAGEAWWIEIRSDAPLLIDLDGDWTAMVAAGTNTIYSNHDVNNTTSFSSNRWWRTPSEITVREAP